MKLIDVHSRLRGLKQPVFQTSDAVACLGMKKAYVSRILARLAESDHIVRLKRGVWAFPQGLNPLSLPEYLTGPFPSYVSLQSAMYYHGIVSQVPTVIYAVSLARTRRFETPLGTVSIHHIDPPFFFGFECTEREGIRMATAEKALLDFLYLSPARSGLFRALPELELPRRFSVRVAREIIRRIRSLRRRTAVSARFDEIMCGRSR